MSLVDSFKIESIGTKITKMRVRGYSADRDLSYWAIKDIKDTLVAAGWTVASKLVASGSLYTPGWFVNHGPTLFKSIPKAGSDVTTEYISETLNDMCKCAIDCNGVYCLASFGLGGHECHEQCRNGCVGVGLNCPCGHTCCREDDDCTVHLDTTSPGCDASGNYCNGWFTGDFNEFAKNLTGGSTSGCGIDCLDPYYSSAPNADGISVLVTATSGGPEYNAPWFKTAIGVGLDLNGAPTLGIYGGGYVMKSGINPTTGDQYFVSIFQNEIGQISFKVGTSEFRLNVRGVLAGLAVPPAYKVIANQCQFVIFDKANSIDTPGGFGNGGNSFFVSSPWVKHGTGISSAVFALGPGALMNSCTWEIHYTSIINGVQNDGTAAQNSWVGFGMSERNFSFNQPLRTTNDKLIISNAWIFVPTNSTDEARIIGKVWGGMMLSDVSPKNAIQSYLGGEYHQISRQASPSVCSLWVDGGDEI